MNSLSFALRCCFLLAIVALFSSGAFAADAPKPRKIVLIAGPITGHPKDAHEYEKNVILLKQLLDTSPTLQGKATVEIHFKGWPADERTLDDADTILITSDGCDRRLEDHPFYVGNRMETLERQMKRGCGLAQFHWSTFNPVKAHDRITQWLGGYFDYESGTAANKWRSAITTRGDWTCEPHATHPITRGVKPFKLKEEFYHHIRFLDDDPRLAPIITVGKSDKHEWTVGWAVERADTGRGFGFTGGHFYENWWNEDFRRMIVNAIAWTAKIEIPPQGIETAIEKRFSALILTGHNHPAHDWSSVTASLIGILELDPYAIVHVTENPEELATDKLKNYDLLVLNYCNWDRGGLSDAAKKGFTDFVENGGGLSVIHFANGAFNATLPAKDSEWPAFRKMVRRTWMHGEGRSGHDNFGPFKVEIAKVDHPITRGLATFDTIDELYFRQEGDAAIEPLATAKSKVTGKDEPMAWAHEQGKGRVFQTVLGHDAISIRAAGALIRRGSVWAARRENISFDPPVAIAEKLMFRSGSQWKPVSPTRAPAASVESAKPQAAGVASLDKAFGKALAGGLVVEGKDEFRSPPITVECWALVKSKGGFNILVASEPKDSPTHWELYTYAGSGVLSAYLPGTKEGEIKSEADITDGKWHHVAFVYEAARVRLYVDGKLVKDQAIARGDGKPLGGALALGRLVEGTVGLDGAVDDVRIRRGAVEVKEVVKKPVAKDENTIGLWDFETIAAVDSAKPQAAGVLPATKVDMADKEVNPSLQKEADWVDDRWSKTDYGSLFSCSMRVGNRDVPKAMVIRVGENNDGAVCFDASNLTVQGSWTGDMVKINPGRYGLIRGPQPGGKIAFSPPKNLGWLEQKSESLRYRGLHMNGKRVVLSYEVAGAAVLESPWAQSGDGFVAFSRSFEFAPCKVERRLALADDSVSIVLVGPTHKCSIDRAKGVSSLIIGASEEVQRIKVLMAAGDTVPAKFEAIAARSDPAENLSDLAKPAAPRWADVLTTKGQVSAVAAPYVVDTITVPFENPWKSLLFLAGHDFLPDGRAIVASIHGDIWLVTGINDKLEKITWRRFATGLYQPMGVKILGNRIYILGRDQITQLHDRNNDGEADHYECFSNLINTSMGGHDYAACLETDRAGNFHYIDPRGVHRISADGRRIETLATGFRNPNGMSVGPTDEITAAPQEGNWTPSSLIALIKPGAKEPYFGFGGPRITPDRPLGYDLPLLFVPHHVDNSSGGQVWVTSDKWGPLKGQMLNLSFGMCTAHLVLRDEAGPQPQGLIVPLKIRCSSGIMRGRFSPHDGQLYVSGLRGWQTNAVHDGCFQRIRYTGKKVNLPIAWRAEQGALVLTFAEPLDRELAEDPAGYAVEQWNYQYTGNYGSKEYSANHPGVEGHDAVKVKSAKLSSDGKSVRLSLPDLKPVQQFKVKYDLESADGQTVRGEAFGTIHELRK